MKRKFGIILLLFVPLIVQSQPIVNHPTYKSSKQNNVEINHIGVSNNHTVISFTYTVSNKFKKGDYLSLNKDIHLRDYQGKKYSFAFAKGVHVSPQKNYDIHSGQHIDFTLFFEKLEVGISEIDIIGESMSFYLVSVPFNSILKNGKKFKVTYNSFIMSTMNEKGSTIISDKEEGKSFNHIIFNNNNNGDVVIYYEDLEIELKKISAISKGEIEDLPFIQFTALDKKNKKWKIKYFGRKATQIIFEDAQIIFYNI